MWKIIVCISISFFLASCTGKNGEPVTATSGMKDMLSMPTMAEFSQARRMSNRSEERQREAYDAFVIRNNVANYVAKKTLADDPETRIRILDERNRILLKKYFDDFTDQKITDENIQAYYQENQEQYAHHSYALEYALIKHHKIEDADKAAKALDTVRESFKSEQTFSSIATPEDVELGKIDIDSETSDQAIVKSLVGVEAAGVTDIVMTNRGMQVFRVVEKTSTAKPLDDVRDGIRYELSQKSKVEELARLESLVQ